MPVKIYKPTTPSLRGVVGMDYSDITTTKPLKSLLTDLRKTGGQQQPRQGDHAPSRQQLQAQCALSHY